MRPPVARSDHSSWSGFPSPLSPSRVAPAPARAAVKPAKEERPETGGQGEAGTAGGVAEARGSAGGTGNAGSSGGAGTTGEAGTPAALAAAARRGGGDDGGAGAAARGWREPAGGAAARAAARPGSAGRAAKAERPGRRRRGPGGRARRGHRLRRRHDRQRLHAAHELPQSLRHRLRSHAGGERPEGRHAWSALFNPSGSGTIYFNGPGADESYVQDIYNNDVRSEGMSYGMMVAVQLDHQTEFDRLWTWVKNHMAQGTTGEIRWRARPRARGAPAVERRTARSTSRPPSSSPRTAGATRPAPPRLPTRPRPSGFSTWYGPSTSTRNTTWSSSSPARTTWILRTSCRPSTRCGPASTPRMRPSGRNLRPRGAPTCRRWWTATASVPTKPASRPQTRRPPMPIRPDASSTS